MSPRVRRWIAGSMAIAATIAWPATQLTIARDEPPFTLGLSWFAIVLTAVDVWVSTDVRAAQDDDKPTSTMPSHTAEAWDEQSLNLPLISGGVNTEQIRRADLQRRRTAQALRAGLQQAGPINDPTDLVAKGVPDDELEAFTEAQADDDGDTP